MADHQLGAWRYLHAPVWREKGVQWGRMAQLLDLIAEGEPGIRHQYRGTLNYHRQRSEDFCKAEYCADLAGRCTQDPELAVIRRAILNVMKEHLELAVRTW